MATFLASLLLIGLAVLGLSLGILFGRRPLAGSCGGVCQTCTAGCGRPAARPGEEQA